MVLEVSTQGSAGGFFCRHFFVTSLMGSQGVHSLEATGLLGPTVAGRGSEGIPGFLRNGDS